MHFTWYLVAIAGWWDADDDNNYRDSLFSLSHCIVRADNENFAQNHQRSLGLEFPSQFISFATTTARMQYPDSQFLVLLPLWRHAHDLITLNPLAGGVETPTDQRIIFPAISSAQHHTLPNNHYPYNE